MAKLFSMPKVPETLSAPSPVPPSPVPPPYVVAPEPVRTPDPASQPRPEQAGGPEDDGAGPAVPPPVPLKRGRIGTVATSWRGVLAVNGGLPRRKSLLGE